MAIEETSPEPGAPGGDGEPDDLQMIKGIGPSIEKTLNDLGIHRFQQIAPRPAAIATHSPHTAEEIKALLSDIPNLIHINVEVHSE